jgi:hypothetical protein
VLVICRLTSWISLYAHPHKLPSSQATLHQVPFQRQFDGLALTVDAELAQDGMQMIAGRGIADTECVGNLTGRLALHQER